MDPLLPKAKQWIDEKKDPRSARWQAGLEAVMELVAPHMNKGWLTPVSPLKKEDLPLFKAAVERVDLSPGVFAAFFPPQSADPILPPDSIEELVRIEKGKPSYKIIIQRPGKDSRLLCAEISPHARRPGVDIFQAGAFLGNFDFDTHDICIMELTKITRAHAWEKDRWTQQDYLTYTLNWFEKTCLLNLPDISVDKQYSFFHSPTLMKMNRVDALFLILNEKICRDFKKDPEPLQKTLLPGGESLKTKKERIGAWESVAENALLDLLNLIKNLNLLDFANFTNAENFKFQNEFVRTVRKLSFDIEEIMESHRLKIG
ncbi:MAG: hypothetical protein KKH99_13880 [Proteobacteria bacterium]|nr:hypothetical protein [Pseudomonadota bacterium]